jgi:hypothetical protein
MHKQLEITRKEIEEHEAFRVAMENMVLVIDYSGPILQHYFSKQPQIGKDELTLSHGSTKSITFTSMH